MIQKNLTGTGVSGLAAQAISGIVIDAIVATGSTQATATLISSDTSVFSVVAPGTGAIFGQGSENDQYTIINSGANALLIYPPVGGTIGGGSVNSPFSLPANGTLSVLYLANLTIHINNDISTLSMPSGSSLIGHIASGAGAIARTAQGKLRDVVSADDYVTPQAAIDTGAGLIKFSTKIYILTTALVVSAGQRLVGDGIGKTFLLQTSATADGVYFNFPTYIPGGGLSDLSIMTGASTYLTGTGSTGAGIRLVQANGNFSCDRFEVAGFATGIHVKNCYYAKFNNFQVLYARDYGIRLASPSGGASSAGIFFRDAKVSNFGFAGDNTASIGMLIEQSGGDFLSALDFTSFNKGIVIKPQSGDFVVYLFMLQVLSDASTDDGITIDSSLSGIAALEFSQCWSAFSTNGHGVRFIGAAIDGVQWIGGRIRENGKHGIFAEGGSNLSFVGAQIARNSKLTTNTYDGAYIGAAVSSIQFVGGRSGNFASGLGHSQANGVQVQVGFTGSMTFTGIDLSNPGAGKSGLANNSSIIPAMVNCLPLFSGYNPPRNNLLAYTTVGTVLAATTTYMGANANQANEFSTFVVVGIAGSVTRMYVASTGAPGVGETFTYTLRKNQADTALSATISGAASVSEETFGAITFSKNDTIAVKLTTSAAAAVEAHRLVIEYSA